MKYDNLNIDELVGDLNRVSAESTPGNDDFMKKFLQLPQSSGYVVARILPRVPGGPLYQMTRVHTLQYGGGKKTFHCSRELVNTARGQRWQNAPGVTDCVICRHYTRLWSLIDKMDENSSKTSRMADARAIKPVERYYYNVIVRNDPDGCPKIYSCGKTVHQIILKSIIGSDGERGLGDVSHPINGRDFKIVKTVKGEFPDYAQSRFLDVSPLGTPDEVEKWLEGRHDLKALRQVKPYTEVYQALMVHCGKARPANANDDADLLALEGEPSKDKSPISIIPSQSAILDGGADPADDLLDDEWREMLDK